MMPKEFMTTDMAQELAVCVQRLNDLHIRMVILQRKIDEHTKLIARQGRELSRQRQRHAIHQRKASEESPNSQH